MSAEREHPWLRLAQVIVTISLMAVLFRRMEWATLPPLLANLRWNLIILGIALVLISHLINVARWQYLLQHRVIGYSTLLALYGAGLFSSNFLPTGFGGDGVRVVLLGRRVSLPQAILSVGLDRCVGLVALSTLLGTGLWIGLPPSLAPNTSGLVAALNQWEILLPFLLLVAAIGLLSLAAWSRLLGLRSVAPGAFAKFTDHVALSRRTIGRWFQLFTGGYVLSILSQLCIVTANWVMLRAVGIAATPDAPIWLVLAVTLSLLFPVAMNGLGVQEAAYVAILNAYGVGNTPALVAAVLTRLVQALFALAGGAGWLFCTRPVETSTTMSSSDA